MSGQSRISATWRIHTRDRQARVGQLVLVATNGRTQGGWGPVVWCVVGLDGEVAASGEVWQGREYQALVRQAMLDAERAAAQLEA